MSEHIIFYTNNKNQLEVLDTSGFFIGWPDPPSTETLKQILINSQHVYLALSINKLIGFINATSDKILSAYIPLLEVLPEYQGRGIGKNLVTHMKRELENYYMIDICCDEDVVEFYERNGFKKGHSVMLRNYQNQSGAIK